MSHNKTPKQLRLEARIQEYLVQVQKYNLLIQECHQEIQKIKELEATSHLHVSDHAIQRFKQRVMELPDKKIRQLLSSGELLEKYRFKGSGRYRLPDYPHVILVIKDSCVVTVFNKESPEERLKMLASYMDYFIDELVNQALGENTHIIRPKTYRKLYWKNQLAA